VEPRAGFEPATYGFPSYGYKAVALAAEPPGLYLPPSSCVRSFKNLVPGAGFELATSGHGPIVFCSPDYESGAQTRLGYPGYTQYITQHKFNYLSPQHHHAKKKCSTD
jgi:hypothetical protein